MQPIPLAIFAFLGTLFFGTIASLLGAAFTKKSEPVRIFFKTIHKSDMMHHRNRSITVGLRYRTDHRIIICSFAFCPLSDFSLPIPIHFGLFALVSYLIILMMYFFTGMPEKNNWVDMAK